MTNVGFPPFSTCVSHLQIWCLTAHHDDSFGFAFSRFIPQSFLLHTDCAATALTPTSCRSPPGRETGATEVTHRPRTFVICCSVGPVKTHFLNHSTEFFSGYVSSLLREPTVAKKASVMQCGTLPSLSWELTSSHLIHLG